MIQPSCKSCLLHASVTTTEQAKQNYIQLDPHWMCHMGIEPEERVWVKANDSSLMWIAAVLPGEEGKGQLAVYGEYANLMSVDTKLSIYGFHQPFLKVITWADWEAEEPPVVIQLSDGNQIDVVRISTEMDRHVNLQRGEWACEQSI